MPKLSKKTSTKTSSLKKKNVPKASSQLPSFVRFSRDVYRVLLENRSVFLRLVALAAIISLLISGLSSYTYYQGLTQATDEVAGQLSEGGFRTAIEVGALTVSVVSGAASSTLTESQQIFGATYFLLLWLVVVWLLRHILSGSTIKLRDGLYNASAPIISTCLVALVGILQLLPFALIVALVTAVASTGALGGLLWTGLGTIVIVCFAALTLYWLAGTVFAGVIVTLPGTYPLAALRSARQVISGYRRQVVIRLLWLGLTVSVAMVVAVMPVVLLDALTGYQLPLLVVLVSQFMASALFIYGSAYVYLLYRGIIDEQG